MFIQGIIKGNTVLLENSENLKALDGRRVLLSIISEDGSETGSETVLENRLAYLKELRMRARRPSGHAAEIIEYIRESRDHDRF